MEQNLSLYRVFYTVAATGNISKAAEQLFISQPAISKSIRKLEQGLEVTLFSRNSRGVQLTEEGEILYEYVEKAFYSLHMGESRIRKINELGIGHLNIGVSTTLCKYVLLPYLQEFMELYPHIKISIQCQSSNKTLQLLRENKVDIGLIGEPEKLHFARFEKFQEIHDVFVSRRSYYNKMLGQNVKAEELHHAATLMLLDKDNMTRQYVDYFLNTHHVEAEHLLEVSSMDLLIEFSRLGLGVACVIREFVEQDIENGSLVEVPLPVHIPSRNIGFAYSTHVQQSSAVREFLNFYKEKQMQHLTEQE